MSSFAFLIVIGLLMAPAALARPPNIILKWMPIYVGLLVLPRFFHGRLNLFAFLARHLSRRPRSVQTPHFQDVPVA